MAVWSKLPGWRPIDRPGGESVYNISLEAVRGAQKGTAQIGATCASEDAL